MIATIEICELLSCKAQDYRQGAALVISSEGGNLAGGREYVYIDASADTLRTLAAELARVADTIDQQEAAKCKQAA